MYGLNNLDSYLKFSICIQDATKMAFIKIRKLSQNTVKPIIIYIKCTNYITNEEWFWDGDRGLTTHCLTCLENQDVVFVSVGDREKQNIKLNRFCAPPPDIKN